MEKKGPIKKGLKYSPQKLVGQSTIFLRNHSGTHLMELDKSLNEEQERREWVALNPTWQHENRGPLHRDRLSWLKEKVEKCGWGNWLVLGSGGGYLEKEWPLPNPPVSLDLDLTVLNPPRGLAGNVLKLPFGEGQFDGVVVSEVLEHVADPLAALCQVAWVLKPRGYALVTVPNWFALESLRAQVRHHPGYGHHLSRGGPDWWTRKFKNSGFKVVEEGPLTLLPYIPYFLGPIKSLEEKVLSPALDKKRLAVEDKVRHLWPFHHLGLCHRFLLQKP